MADHTIVADFRGPGADGVVEAVREGAESAGCTFHEVEDEHGPGYRMEGPSRVVELILHLLMKRKMGVPVSGAAPSAIMHTKMPALICPYCGGRSDVHTSVNGATPKIGDASICFYCGEVAVFDADMQLVQTQDPDVIYNPQVIAVRAMVQKRLQEAGGIN